MKKIAYVFRGSPASGKGTLVKKFIELLPGRVAKLELDDFRWGFHMHNRKPADFTDEEHIFAYKNFLSQLENYCEKGDYILVIEGLFSSHTPGPHGNLKEILAILKKHGFEYTAFLLVADYKILWKRNQEREYVVPESEFKDLYEYVNKDTSEEEIRIDVSGSTDNALKQIKSHAGLQSGS